MFANETLEGREEVFDVASYNSLGNLDNLLFNPILLVVKIFAFAGRISNKSSMILLEEVEIII